MFPIMVFDATYWFFIMPQIIHNCLYLSVHDIVTLGSQILNYQLNPTTHSKL